MDNTGEGDLFWHLHHEILLERASEPIQNRIDYIQNYKNADERGMRLHLLRRANISDDLADLLDELDFESSDSVNPLVMQLIEQEHATTCFPNCPWDGTTIFPNKY